MVHILPTSLCFLDYTDAAQFKLVCKAMEVDLVVMNYSAETLLACPPTPTYIACSFPAVLADTSNLVDKDRPETFDRLSS